MREAFRRMSMKLVAEDHRRHKMLQAAALMMLLLLPFFSPGKGYAQQRETAYVKRVVDGDTVVLQLHDVEEKGRLIGVDTPEKNHPLRPVQFFSHEATEFLRRLCEGKRVFLEYDQERRDRYGRLLVYLFLEDGRLVNAEIIKQGYGFAYTRFPFRHLKEFRSHETEARKSGRGLWKNEGADELKWLLSMGRKPFKVYGMAGGKWGIEYEGYAKLRLDEKELLSELSDLRLWIDELNDDDFHRTLSENGWIQVEESP